MTAALIRPVSPFAAATLAPLPFLGLAAVMGGGWALLALLVMTVWRILLDGLIATAGAGAAPGTEWPAAGRLSQALGLLHFPVLALGVAAVSGVTGLGFWEGAAAFLAFGMYLGQVSTSNAHELIHRTDRFRFTLGKWVLISLLYGHHVTAHLKVHHRFVATPDDPNSAYLGQGFYEFLGQAWGGSFLAGWEIERSAARIRGEALPWWRHPYAGYLIGGAAFVLASALAFGLSGVMAFLLLAFYAQLQLILSDYVQHYGLRRRRTGQGEWETVAPWHSWNAANWYSGGLMLNAPRHSEHHTHPAVPYPELGLPDHMEGPRLPRSLPTMGAVALVPPLWRRMMDRRAAAWQARIDDAAISRSPRLAPRPAGAAPDDTMPDRRPSPPDRAAAAGPVPPSLPPSLLPSLPPSPPPSPRAGQSRRPQPDGAAQVASSALWNGGAPPVLPADTTPAQAAAHPAAAPPVLGPVPARGAEGPNGRTAPARFLRSSALFRPEEPGAEASSPPAGAEAAPPHDPARDPARDRTIRAEHAVVATGPAAGAADRNPAGATDVEATIAELVQSARREARRRRVQFPAIGPDEPAVDSGKLDRVRSLAESGRIAARALAALLRGAPPDRLSPGD